MAIADLWLVIGNTVHNAYVIPEFSLKMYAMVNMHVEVQRIFQLF